MKIGAKTSNKLQKEKFFKHLNYTLGNEDTSLELNVLPDSVKHVFTIAGSGSRVLPMFARNPQLVTCVDVSIEQLYLTELRIESARKLEHQEYMQFWGYPPEFIEPLLRLSMFSKINLSKPAKDYWDRYFEDNNWSSPLYDGKWERTFSRLSRVNRLITGSKGAHLFTYTNANDYYLYLGKGFPHKRWSLVVRILGNAVVFNKLLYKGVFPVKNMPGSMYSYYMNAFKAIFAQGPVKNNYFMQMLFYGKIQYSEGNPIECNEEIYNRIKNGLQKTEIVYVNSDLFTAANNTKTLIDFISFSDVPSYFTGDLERTYLQDLKPHLTPNAIIVNRYYLRNPDSTNFDGYQNISKMYDKQIVNEKVQMYQIDILRKLP